MQLDKFIVLGVTHKEVNMEERENFIKANPEKVIQELYDTKKIKGYINLSTCLRVEFYIELQKEDDLLVVVEEFSEIENIFYKKGSEAVYYLFKVVCGFHSVIKGEDQILSQTKKAFFYSQENKCSSKILNIVFNKSIALGKMFRTESNICKNALSLEAISVNFLKYLVGDIKDKKILILGVGELAQGILKILAKMGHEKLSITNRTTHKTIEIMDKYNSKFIDFSDKEEEIVKNDIIISITSAPHYVIKNKEMTVLDKNKKYLFLDLAVPRDIESEIGERENVTLYNLNDIWNIYNENIENRESLLEEYSYLLDAQMKNVNKSLNYIEGK
ncbi:MAG: glutamyl-tRNA reductase [Fusobacteriaceae bacterium]